MPCEESLREEASEGGRDEGQCFKIDRFVRDQPFRLCVCQRVKFRGRLKRGVNGYDSEARRVRVRHMTIGIYGILLV